MGTLMEGSVCVQLFDAVHEEAVTRKKVCAVANRQSGSRARHAQFEISSKSVNGQYNELT